MHKYVYMCKPISRRAARPTCDSICVYRCVWLLYTCIHLRVHVYHIYTFSYAFTRTYSCQRVQRIHICEGECTDMYMHLFIYTYMHVHMKYSMYLRKENSAQECKREANAGHCVWVCTLVHIRVQKKCVCVQDMCVHAYTCVYIPVYIYVYNKRICVCIYHDVCVYIFTCVYTK